MNKCLVKIIILALLWPFGLSAGHLHVPVTDPVYPFLERMAVQGYLTDYLDGALPLTRDDVIGYLQDLEAQRGQFSEHDRNILDELLADYRYELTDRKHPIIEQGRNTYMPFSSLRDFGAALGNVFSYDRNREADHLVTFEKDEEMLWLDWDEMVRLETKDKLFRYLKQDAFRLSISIGEHFSAYGDAYIYYMKTESGFEEPAPEYKGGFLARRAAVADDGISQDFDYTYGYVRYSSIIGDIAMGLEPRIWGNSRRSLIYADEVDPFASISWQRNFGRSRLSWFHGFINPPDEILLDADTQKYGYIDKYIVGHRWEVPMGKRLQVAFTEMLIYGDRDPELAYFVPFVFYWPVQHSLTEANEDNIIWYLEGQLFPFNGLKLYGTVAIDEIRIEDIFKDSAANRWGAQGGFLISPRRLLLIPFATDLRVEFTATRPWLYTHRVPMSGTYTHNGRSLGFPYGPNSQLLYIENRWWLNPRSTLQLRYQQLKHGEDEKKPGEAGYYPIGGDSNQNYSQANPAFRYTTTWLMGDIHTTRDFTLEWAYQLTNILHIQLAYSHRIEEDATNDFFSFQIRFDY